MNLFKRWTTSVAASFDWVVTQVENHDALVTAAIRDMQAAGAKAKVQLGRVRRDGERMTQRLAELRELETVWADRAVRSHAEDKERALECLARKRQVQREITSIEQQCKEHTRVEAQLTKDLKIIDERVGELKRKKNTFNARQYRAEAMKAGQLSELGIIGEIDEVFDRWECKLGEYESLAADADTFEEDFRREENRTELEAELDALVRAQS